MFKELDPVLHAELRLSVVSILITVIEADFTFLKEKTGASSGNLSIQLDRLEKSGYIEIRKEFVGKRPRTVCSITDIGRDAFHQYVEVLKEYLHLK
ncbi:MAG: winged helix-turn-helix domain-containing protein [Bacteroidales bacterium]